MRTQTRHHGSLPQTRNCADRIQSTPWILCPPNCPHDDPEFEYIQKFVYNLEFYAQFRKVPKIHVTAFTRLVEGSRGRAGPFCVTFDFAPLPIPSSANFAQVPDNQETPDSLSLSSDFFPHPPFHCPSQ